MKNILFISFFTTVLCCAVDIQPDAVLQEAKDQFSKNNYDLAMEKIIWYIDNSDKIDPALSGVRGSDGFENFYKISRKAKGGVEKYNQRVNEAFQASISDATDPSKSIIKGMPKNHKDFLDYLGLAEKTQTHKEICDNFARLETVNPGLATWEFYPVAQHLAAEGLFEKMNKYVEEWSKEEASITRSMISDYQMVRDGKFNGRDLMSYHLTKIKLIKLVYLKNKRDIDMMMLDSFCQMNLTDEENKIINDKNVKF